jgi:hypothetical protein
MSMEIHVLFRGRLPGKAALNRTMKELGFPLAIVPAKGPLEEQNGFMPMRLQREETGVEFDVFDGRAAVDELSSGLDVDPQFDRSANFRWGGDENEMLCALCAAAALAKLVDGVVLDAQEDKLISPGAAIDAARDAVKPHLKSDAKSTRARPTHIKRYQTAAAAAQRPRPHRPTPARAAGTTPDARRAVRAGEQAFGPAAGLPQTSLRDAGLRR